MENFESNYNKIVECLNNYQCFTGEYYPVLLKALGLLIDACSDYIQSEKTEMIDSFITLFLHFTEIPLIVEDKNDIAYANNFMQLCFYSQNLY